MEKMEKGGVGRKQKITALFFVLLLLVTMLAGCSEQKEEVRLEENLGQELLANTDFKDKLELVDDEQVSAMYGIDKVISPEFTVYMSTGATAEEIAIFRVESKENKSKVEEAIQMRIEDQKKIMEGYLPEEMAKLNNPIIKKNQYYVVLCTTDDADGAQKVLEQYF